MAHKIITFIFTAIVMGSSFADEQLKITSAKSAWLNKGSLYVSAGYPQNHTEFQSQLKILWNNSDAKITQNKSRQIWKEIPIKQLENIFGVIDKLYLATWGGEIKKYQVKNAYIFQWNCNESLVPILNLGPYKFKTKPSEWSVVAFGVSLFPEEADIRPVDQSLIPKEFYGVLRYPGGWELWIDGVKSFSYIARREEHNPSPKNLLVDHITGKTRIIIEKSPFDYRC